MATDESIIKYLESLADYRESLYKELYRWMETMPPTPMPLSKGTRSYLSEHWGEFREALLLKSEAKIAAIAEAAERSVNDYYREAVAQEGIPKDIHDLLNEQHQHIMSILRKVERMETVPMLRNNDFKTS